jgi:hypothetical protein
MKKRYHKLANAYDAWWFLYYHPKFQRMIRNPITPKRADKMEAAGFLVSRDRSGKCYWYMRHMPVPAITENLSVHYAKTDGNRVTNDLKKNVSVECWLEFGSVKYGYMAGEINADWDTETGEMNYHDYRLDSGGPTFDAALIMMAKKVRKVYGDYSLRTPADPCGPKPCADCKKIGVTMKRLGLEGKKKKPVVS